MFSTMLRGPSAATLSLVLTASAAHPQEALPTIDIAAERPAAGGPGSGKPDLTPQNSYVVPNSSVGTKTDTPVMNTPINVQAITEKVLDDQQATTLAQALTNISGAYVAGGGGAIDGTSNRSGGIFVRGFLTQDYYQDGFRINGAFSGIDFTGSRQFANIGSIDLLKGPAAILYGLSEPGGIINITTKGPQDTPHYSVQQQIGALAFYRTSLSATGPVTADKSVLYRIDMSYENNGAPFGSSIDRTYSQNFFVAPVVKWQIDNDNWIKLEVNYSNDKFTPYLAYAPTINGSLIYPPRSNSYMGASTLATDPTFYAALTGEHKFDNDWSLKSRVAFYSTNYNYNVVNPLSNSSGANPLITDITAVGSQQLASWQTNHDIVGHFDLLGTKNTLLLGGDYSRYTWASVSQGLVPWGFSLISLADPVVPGIPILPTFSTTHTENYNRQDMAGLYVQDQVELPYGLHVMAGARYQYIYQENTSSSAKGFVSGAVSESASPLHQARVTPRFGLLWRPREWVSVYGNYTEGFAANAGTIYPGQLAPPSNAKSWEAGAKFEFFDGRLRANVDYYYLLKTNIPVGDPDTSHLCGGTPSCSVVVGAGRSSGPEIDIQGELLPGWNVILAYTNQDVRVAEGKTTTNSGTRLANLSPGQRFPNVPRNLARLSTTYEFQTPLLKGLKVGAGYTYHGSQVIYDGSAKYNGTIPLLASWGTVDLMAAYAFDLDGVKTTAQLNATNIFDHTYYTAAFVAGTPSSNYSITGGRLSYGAPFNIVGSLRFEF